MPNRDREALLRRAYALFNDRDIDGLLAMMTEDVEWPDVIHGAVLRDKGAIRSYWEGQFATSDPRVEPTAFIESGDDLVAVVDQRVLDVQGAPLAPPAVVFHRYSFEGDRVRRMAVFTERSDAVGSS